MKFLRSYIDTWKRLPTAIKWFYVCLAFSMPRFVYLWWIRESIILAWLDLVVLSILGLCMIMGWLHNMKMYRRLKAKKQVNDRCFEILDHWDKEISALSWDLYEAARHPNNDGEIEALNNRIDEAHKRKDRELAAMRKQP